MSPRGVLRGVLKGFLKGLLRGSLKMVSGGLCRRERRRGFRK